MAQLIDKSEMENICRSTIFGPRVFKAILSSTILQYLFLITISSPMKINVWQPETWFRTFIGVVYTIGFSYFIPFAIVLTILTFIYFRKVETGGKYFKTRFSMMFHMFSIHNCGICCLHTFIGGVVCYMYVRNFLDSSYGNLSTSCKDFVASNCLNERHIYLILCGSWVGFYSYLQTYIKTTNLDFPVVHQSKLVQVKSELRVILKRAIVDALTPSAIFAVLYYIKGEHFRDCLGEFLNLQVDEAFISTGTMRLTLFFYSWIVVLMFLITLYTVKLILQVFLTDHITFQITPVPVSNCITLAQALNVTKPQAMQYLGFQDLMVLADKDRQRRQELFSLSQPGGHPHNWNSISEVCLRLINTFTADLTEASMETRLTTDVSKATNEDGHFATMPNHICSRTSGDLRNLSVQESTYIRAKPKTTLLSNAIATTNNFFREVVLKKPGISYFFSELPDAKVQHCISNCQPVIWACQSLALLAAASFQEDKYGVLQKDLPAIITGLLQLKQILDKLQKPGNQRKSNRSENFETKMKHALRSAVRRSMYRITVTFGTYLEDLPLASDVLHQVQNFIKYRD